MSNKKEIQLVDLYIMNPLDSTQHIMSWLHIHNVMQFAKDAAGRIHLQKSFWGISGAFQQRSTKAFNE